MRFGFEGGIEREKPPYEVESFEHSKTREFDELWDLVSTPRFKLDGSYGDNLDGSHIG
jgi:RNAse (barnase) inhibitor barstar